MEMKTKQKFEEGEVERIKKFLSIKEFAAMLGISERTAYNIVRRGEVPGAFQLYGKDTTWRIPMKGIEEWMKRKERKE